MKHLVGDVSFTLSVTEPLDIRGHLLAGANVGPGAVLFVDGYVAGEISVEKDAQLFVAGVIGATVSRNDGVIAASGHLGTPLELIPGRLLVWEGTVLSLGGAELILGSAGELQERDLDRPEEIGPRVFQWDSFYERFTAIEDVAVIAEFDAFRLTIPRPFEL